MPRCGVPCGVSAQNYVQRLTACTRISSSSCPCARPLEPDDLQKQAGATLAETRAAKAFFCVGALPHAALEPLRTRIRHGVSQVVRDKILKRKTFRLIPRARPLLRVALFLSALACRVSSRSGPGSGLEDASESESSALTYTFNQSAGLRLSISPDCRSSCGKPRILCIHS